MGYTGMMIKKQKLLNKKLRKLKIKNKKNYTVV